MIKITTLASLLLLAILPVTTYSVNTTDIVKPIKNQKEKINKNKYPKLTTTSDMPYNLITLKKAISQLRNKNYSSARETLKPIIKKRYADAYYYMFVSYMPWELFGYIKDLPYDWENGIPWLRKAADAGHAKAQLTFSDWNWLGYAGKMRPNYDIINIHNVYHYAKLSADQGYTLAQSQMNYILLGLSPQIIKSGIMKNITKLEAAAKMWVILSTLPSQTMLEKQILNSKPGKSIQIKKMALHWIKTHPAAYKQRTISVLEPESFQPSLQ